ncbi:ABC transporter C family member 8 isoform X2 [Populus alba]|uniref:ABC transporter C family member 8 isoform X2 n=1 Tax=Populus alba TaxID=43335 RepID=UPI003CC753A1
MVPWCSNLSTLFHHHDSATSISLKLPSNREGEKKEGAGTESKLGQAGVISRLIISWINPVLKLGYSKPLVLEDIPTLLPEDESQVAYKRFSYIWGSLSRDFNSSNAKNLLLRTLAITQWRENLFVGVCALVRTIAVVVLPLILYAFVQYIKNESKIASKGLVLVGCLAVIKFMESLSQRHCYFNARRSGLRMRSAIMVAIYQKQLILSSLGRKRHSTGEIMNYIAFDAYRMGDTLWWFHRAWSLVLQLFLSIGIIFKVVGLAALPGLVPILVVIILDIPFAKLHKKHQSQFMVAQEERLRATMETLNNMKTIKLQSWEDKFKSTIDLLRGTEYRYLAKMQAKRPYTTVLYWMSPTIVSAVVFIGCVLIRGTPLNAATIFTVLATLRGMSEPMRWIPESLSLLIQAKVSVDRLNTFLLEDELNVEEMQVSSKSLDKSSNKCVEIQGGNFSWEPESAVLVLKDINLEVKRGQKIAICGPVGSGKTSLLYAILREIPKISGSVNVFGSIAYVSQAPWIRSGTIRDNILCGEPMDRTRYDMVTKACALDKDISSFNHGDLTEIGQRGNNLSGGQKQRIQLARAVYIDADIYILDDSLSAVDVHTAAVLSKKCISATLKDKTVIFVTHHLEFLTDADKILVMEGGQIMQAGSFEELLSAGTTFEQLVNAHKNAVSELVSPEHGNKTETPNSNVDQFEESDECFPSKENNDREILAGDQLTKKEEREILTGDQLTKVEEREISKFGFKPLLDYLRVSKGSLLFGLVILSRIAFSLFQAGASYWLALAIRNPKVSNGILVGVYTGISISSFPFVFLRSFLTVLLGLKASKAFFSGINKSLFEAPMHFFDTTPVGRIYTRVSSDMSALDLDVPLSLGHLVSTTADLLVTIAVMASVTWPVLIVSIPAVMAAIYVQEYYVSTGRELIRINGTTKAPIMNCAAETSLGVITIRAFNIKDIFFKNYLKLIDTDASLSFHSNAAVEWLILRVETLQNLIVLTAALLIVLLPSKNLPGFVGLCLSYALSLNSSQVLMTRCYCDLSNYIVSVERIKQFMCIAPEPPEIVEGMRPPSSWPAYGRIELHDLKIRYRPNAPLVLKGISCTIIEGTRVGVVGRTGSGKTTLISALFRLVEPESGRILIDGLDICNMGLKDLRTKLSIIPQEPTLFKGSVRSNLDPLGQYPDNEIWERNASLKIQSEVFLTFWIHQLVMRGRIGVLGSVNFSVSGEFCLEGTELWC